MAKTDQIVFVSGEEYYLHECDYCERLLEGDPFYYWEHKDFTLCRSCVEKLLDDSTKNSEETQTRPSKIKIPTSIRWEVWERDNFTCLYCGVRKKLSIDHIFPESRGGSLDLNNLATACFTCNTSKGNKTPEEAGMTLENDPRG